MMSHNNRGMIMNKKKLWDKYEIKVRYVPAFLSLIPISQFLILLLGEHYWQGLFASISKMAMVRNLGVSLVSTAAMVQLQSSIAKCWIEESVFGENGENFPTTEMLLYSGGLTPIQRKEQIRNKIIKIIGCTLPSESDELNNLSLARQQVQESVGIIRRVDDKGTMECQYSIRYGFLEILLVV